MDRSQTPPPKRKIRLNSNKRRIINRTLHVRYPPVCVWNDNNLPKAQFIIIIIIYFGRGFKVIKNKLIVEDSSTSRDTEQLTSARID